MTHEPKTSHGHGHTHGHGPKGFRSAVREVFSPHSHDAADSVDDAVESSAIGIRAVKISLVALGVTAVAQVAIVAISGSVALLAAGVWLSRDPDRDALPSPLIGKQAPAYMDRGEFVPESVTNAMVKARLAAPDTAKGFLLDGYPRSVEQAHVLRDMLLDLGKSIDVVLEIQVDEDEVVERMLKRAQEQHRTDDTEPVMRHRLEVYHQQTEPVATYYVDQDMLEVVDGRGSIDDVTARIFAILDSVAK